MSVRKCCVCGARAVSFNRRGSCCDQVCRSARDNGTTRAEQLQREADSIPWPENPFEVLAHGIARRSATL